MKTKYSTKIKDANGKLIEFVPYREYRTPKGGYYQGMSSRAYWRRRSKELLADTLDAGETIIEYEKRRYEEELIKTVEMYKTLIKPYINEKGEFIKPVGADFALKQNRFIKEIEGFKELIDKVEPQILEKHLVDVYLKNGKNIAAELGVEDDLYIFNESVVKTAIHTPWCKDGREFSDRIWQNTDELVSEIKTTLVNDVNRGVSANKTIKTFKQKFGNSAYNTARLVRTETAVIQTKSSLDTYKECGIEMVEVLGSAVDCECSPWIGKKVKVSEAQVGFNVPVFHPQCKCSIAPVVEWE